MDNFEFDIYSYYIDINDIFNILMMFLFLDFSVYFKI